MGNRVIPEHIIDELAIIRVISTLACAQDDVDYEGYRSCFSDQVLIHQPMIDGWEPTLMSADEWTMTGLPKLAGFDVTHHRLFNHIVDVDGDVASCEVDLSAIHQIIENGATDTLTIGGRYSLRLRREGGQWRIFERSLRVRYQIGDPSLMAKAISRADQRAAH